MKITRVSIPLFAAKNLLLCVVSTSWFATTSELHADYEVYSVLTVEWLVDNSDVIVISLEDEKHQEKPTRNIRTLKGDSTSIIFPLRNLQRERFSVGFWRPRARGLAKLSFIRGQSELLQEVYLARPVPVGAGNDLHIEMIAYGVSQYGDLLLTESAFLKAVHTRLHLSTVRAYPAPSRTTVNINTSIRAPSDFPLETTGQTIVLVIPNTIDRRDHYVEALRSGNAAERIYAIDALSQFDDEKAMQAIRDATKCDNASQAFQRTWKTSPLSPPHVLTSADVRAKAKRTLEMLIKD